MRTARDQFAYLYARAVRGFDMSQKLAGAPTRRRPPKQPVRRPMIQLRHAPPPRHSSQTTVVDGVETVRTDRIELKFEGRRCIHARFCVTGAPKVFLANVKGPWIHPEAMPVEAVVEIAHLCPSGAIRYTRLDGGAQEQAPPVNLATVREGGPYAFRAPLMIDGEQHGFRATLCRCGASKSKPFCDGSHHAVEFAATGEPPTTQADPIPGGRWPAGDRSAAQWAACGARQSADHQRHRPGRGPNRHREPVPLRWQRDQALLRWHARQDRFPLGPLDQLGPEVHIPEHARDSGFNVQCGLQIGIAAGLVAFCRARRPRA